MCKKLDEWQKRKLKTFKSYLDSGIWSFADFKKAKERIVNPPDWFTHQIKQNYP